MDNRFLWAEANDGAGLTSDELAASLSSVQRGIVCLDGPTACGKTHLLRKLAAIDGRDVHIRSYREWIEETVLPYLAAGEDEKVLTEGEGQVLCVEDADYLFGKHTSQLVLAKILRGPAKRNLVIITGTELNKKAPLLLAGVRPCKKYRAISQG